jgi:Flp pilus assembly secretin CpaC
MPVKKLVPVKNLFIVVGCLAVSLTWPLRAQAPTPSPVSTPDAVQILPPLPDSSPAPRASSSPVSTPADGLQALPQTPDVAPSPTPAMGAAPTPTMEVAPTPTPLRHSPTAEPGDPALNTNNSFWLDNYPLNDLYQYLARQAGFQYFQNPLIDSIKVTGELFKGRNPVDNMRELALQYNLVLFQKGRTIYALTQDQISTLPQQEYRYELKYLHPKPEDIQRMLGHFLTPERGSATLEPQINTIVVSDNETVIPKIARYLQSIDVPRRQISIQVRVISITTTGDQYTGVDWSSTLGQTGVTLSATAQSNLDASFGFRPFRNFTHSTTVSAPSLTNSGTNVILGPVTVSAVLHALYDNTRAHEENAPLVITEDNQPSTVKVVTRTPIVVSTVTASGNSSVISSDVRYYLDPADAGKGREIGTTLVVTPSILPDNTIRLQIDGTVSTQVGTVPVQNGGGSAVVTNDYPIVNEAHLVNLSRVPSGYSLLLGGFVTIDNSTATNKVPVLGSIPLLGQAFRYKQTTRKRTNLAFLITPIAFQAESPIEVNEQDRAALIGPEKDLADPNLLGRANQNATDFHNALSRGQFQDSDKNPVQAPKQRIRKSLPPPRDSVPQPQSANPDNQ